MYTNCDRCKHVDFCKYADNAKEFEKIINSASHPEIVTAYVSCKKFSPKMSPEFTLKKISKGLEEGKNVTEIAEELRMPESRVRTLSRGLNKK